jgi:hypothetical protein
LRPVQDLGPMPSILPENNLVGKSKTDRTVMQSADWLAAKELADISAADRVIDRLWTFQKTEVLRSGLKDSSKAVFVSVPSSSRTNVLALRLAEKLAGDCGAKALFGDQYFNAEHSRQSKHIPRLQRPFQRRIFTYHGNPEVLKREVADRSVIVVEDVLTTGGSVAAFCRALFDQGILVDSVVGLMGDRRLNIDRITRQRLQESMLKAGIAFDSNQIAARLTRAEAGGLIMQINAARSNHARQKIAGNLQGLLNQDPFADLGRDQAARGYQSAKRADRGNERVSEGIPARPVFEDRRERVGRFEIIVRYGGIEYTQALPVGAEVQNPREFMIGKAEAFATKVVTCRAMKEGFDDEKQLKVKIRRVKEPDEQEKAVHMDRGLAR